MSDQTISFTDDTTDDLSAIQGRLLTAVPACNYYRRLDGHYFISFKELDPEYALVVEYRRLTDTSGGYELLLTARQPVVVFGGARAGERLDWATANRLAWAQMEAAFNRRFPTR